MAGVVVVSNGCRGGEERGAGKRDKGEREEQQQQNLSVLALLLAAIRRSVVSCRMDQQGDDVAAALHRMEIGWPTDVCHVAHVTFDRFHGFLGLPVELQPEVPCRVPSASASVFGVSAESMQCCYDSKGNSVPTILLLMQERLYLQGGLKAEGIFRINPENSQEEHVRDQLNKGIVPDDIDVHCLAGLIKAWFRELPAGILDGLSPEQVLNCNTEEECVELMQQLLPTQAPLLSWAVELMADVVEEEETNKMNARNIAMVFAPNMTQMSDPLTALMHAVQVMNLLKALILKTLREREEAAMEEYSSFSSSPPSEQQGDDDLDSQQEVEISGERRKSISDDEQVTEQVTESRLEVATSEGFREHISDDCQMNHHSSNEYEYRYDTSVKEIEECFLRRLNWKVDSTSPCLSFGDKTARLSCSDFNVRSCFSVSESKQESSITTDEVDWEESESRNVVADAKSLSDRLESSNEVVLLRRWTP